MSVNWIDYIILATILYYIIIGWQTGLVQLLSNLISFLASLWFAIRFNNVVGSFFVEKFGIPLLWSSVVGYICVAFVSEMICAEVISNALAYLPKSFTKSGVNNFFGSFISAINGLCIVAFLLLVVTSFPLRGTVKSDIARSVLGSQIVTVAQIYGGTVKSSMERASEEATRFLTVEPQSQERLHLDIQPTKEPLQYDRASEANMLSFINKERSKQGISSVTLNESMSAVARSYSFEMFEKKFFSHIDPEGHDAAYRMMKANIAFSVVGENLAFAPDVNAANIGLIQSEGHRRNILDPQFHRVGIGVIDGGINGKMFTQLFAD